MWERWALPLMPIGAILTAGGLTGIAAWLRGYAGAGTGIVRVVMGGLLVLALVPLGLRIRAGANDPRQMASAWARAHFAFDILGEPWQFLFPMGMRAASTCAAFKEKTGYAAIERACGLLQPRYGTVALRLPPAAGGGDLRASSGAAGRPVVTILDLRR